MRDAECADCGRMTNEMIISGWGLCKTCRNKPVYEFAFLNRSLESKAGKDFVKRRIRAHLPRPKEAV